MHKSTLYWILRLDFVSCRRYRIVLKTKPRRVLEYEGFPSAANLGFLNLLSGITSAGKFRGSQWKTRPMPSRGHWSLQDVTRLARCTCVCRMERLLHPLGMFGRRAFPVRSKSSSGNSFKAGYPRASRWLNAWVRLMAYALYVATLRTATTYSSPVHLRASCELGHGMSYNAIGTQQGLGSS
jgi:hypothetical protein